MQLQPIDYLTKKERDMLEQMNKEMKQLQDKKEVDEDIFKMNIGNIRMMSSIAKFIVEDFVQPHKLILSTIKLNNNIKEMIYLHLSN